MTGTGARLAFLGEIHQFRVQNHAFRVKDKFLWQALMFRFRLGGFGIRGGIGWRWIGRRGGRWWRRLLCQGNGGRSGDNHQFHSHPQIFSSDLAPSPKGSMGFGNPAGKQFSPMPLHPCP
jgi:hypothetical protein